MRRKKKISGNLSVAENKITDSLTGTEGRIFENISGQSAAISALKEDILSAVSEAMEQHSDRITAEMQNIAGIKDELKLQLNDLSNALADGISAVKAEISQVIEGFNSQFAKLKRQGDDVKDAVDGLTEVFSGMIKDISENMEKKMERITTAADNMSSAVEGMGISIDNLLRQQEDNISAQNDLSGEIAKLSALISTSISSGQENTIDKTRYDELAKSIEKVLAKSGGADKQALAALGAELRELKNTVAGLTSADLSYDLSSIYSELRKMNESGAADIENIKLNQELNTLRNQLNKFDGQEENVETKRKTTKSKPE